MSLPGKLSLAFAAIAGAGILLAGAFGIWNSNQEFTRERFKRERVPEIVDQLVTFYGDNGETWETETERLPVPSYAVLYDKEHKPIDKVRWPPRGARRRAWLRQRIPEVAITRDGKVIGFLRIAEIPHDDDEPHDVIDVVRSPTSWLGFGLLLLTAGASGAFMSRRITRPLQELMAATRAVAAGDLTHRVPVRSQDEIGALAQAFNAMNEQLDRSQQQKRQMTQDVVHDLAQPITRPLQELMAATRAVAAGDLTHRVPVRSQDEIGALAQAFNAMNEQLDRSQQQKRQMTQDVVHDLAQPIMVIRGLAEAMQEGAIDKSAANLQTICQEADRLETLTRNLHILEQADSRRLSLRLAATTPAALIARFRTLYTELARKAGMALQETVAAALPPIYVDGDCIIQVLGNLAHNAFQHAPTGSVVTLSAHKKEDRVLLAVSDEGPGVAEDDLPRIFDRFYRTDAARSQAAGGSGIGLAIVKSLVEAQGGEVWAENVRPHGLRIVIALSAVT